MISVCSVFSRSSLHSANAPRRLYSSSVVFGTLNQALQPWPRRRALHANPITQLPRKRTFFSSNILLREQQQQPDRKGENDAPSQPPKKLASRKPQLKTSLRRVAVEAQRSRDGLQNHRKVISDLVSRARTVKAYCVAEQFNVSTAMSILRNEGYDIDPYDTALFPQVVHAEIPAKDPKSDDYGIGDLFIFPSGTMVAWSLPEELSNRLATHVLLPAAENPHIGHLETEDLEYLEDVKKDNSTIKGDTIILGTKVQSLAQTEAASAGQGASGERNMTGDVSSSPGKIDTVLAKIAFSSGLARSTKLAVLETLLSNYFDSTRSIPTMLSRGSRLPFTRSFILRKTGQLLSVRAQLNLYSELTDSLPDLFWDSKHELGLEGYYDQVGRALDVGVRIKTLNEKMDYAQEIASVLRERLSEKHGLVLEWMIIALITIEVAFEILRLWKEKQEKDRSFKSE